ncbi:conserved hypothetical protein [Ricinus communis]|uniref:Uncharacterized protein n=1 Tax=Ricinus communis TaxID=3988 RepID=B9S7G6_RICCO|nr:conserved hypothetical protein [Ricinus communis]
MDIKSRNWSVTILASFHTSLKTINIEANLQNAKYSHRSSSGKRDCYEDVAIELAQQLV